MGQTKQKRVKSKSHQNRGLKFESMIEDQCKEYHSSEVALIHKVPTEMKLIRGGMGKIVSAFPVQDSKFTDFIGIYKGKAIAIEAKETKNKTSFPLSNISQYQLDFMKLWTGLGGIGYFLIRFSELSKIFLCEGGLLLDTINNLDRKSIPIGMFDRFIELKDMDFLKHVNV